MQSRTANIITLVAAIWLILAPSILGYSLNAAKMNDIWLGIIVGILSIVRLISPLRNIWVSWINVVGGVWLIIAPFVLGYSGRASMWNDIILGLIVAVFAIWSSGVSATTQGTQRQAHA
ncbi:MAG TPA: SPW repeat protein [Patescibacteria group bacterium]|nr:SPW repeat protein [Patescibacteria group bacterium]